MSSNIRLIKICEHCNNEFVGKTTVTKCCSDYCAKRLYKLKQKEQKIAQTELKTEIQRKLKAFITEDEIKAIQAKEFLTLKEAAFLLNITTLTLRRWILAHKVVSEKKGKKHSITRTNINAESFN